jgi:hypothetical protein
VKGREFKIGNLKLKGEGLRELTPRAMTAIEGEEEKTGDG